MSDLTEALKQSIYPPGVKSAPGKAEADWVDAMHRVHRAARLVADGKVVPVEDLEGLLLTDEMIEAAAKAWCEANGHFFDQCPWDDQHRENARAALVAGLREVAK